MQERGFNAGFFFPGRTKRRIILGRGKPIPDLPAEQGQPEFQEAEEQQHACGNQHDQHSVRAALVL